MRTKTSFNLILLALAVVFSGCSKPKEWTVVSPDQQISFKLYEKESHLYYQVLLSDTVIIEESPVGIERNDAQFSSNLSFVSVENQKMIDEKYTLVTGKQLECNNNANELTVTFENDQKAKLGTGQAPLVSKVSPPKLRNASANQPSTSRLNSQ